MTHHICALAAGAGDFIRCTPIEYNWVNQAFWLFSEGGLKFRAINSAKAELINIGDTGSHRKQRMKWFGI